MLSKDAGGFDARPIRCIQADYDIDADSETFLMTYDDVSFQHYVQARWVVTGKTSLP